ncbi:hypothetical protein E2C01_017381 [Portunus trituberculatus]|uniref:Uncharacterized protein n=1 Tax=Portunus trituberculatus TaxID=210409 RepID=A0A5B7DSA7_PORTR|nr:hypothetical protein [Portunus trituberculatus]
MTVTLLTSAASISVTRPETAEFAPGEILSNIDVASILVATMITDFSGTTSELFIGFRVPQMLKSDSGSQKFTGCNFGARHFSGVISLLKHLHRHELRVEGQHVGLVRAVLKHPRQVLAAGHYVHNTQVAIEL